MEVSLLKKLTVLADRDDLLSGERQVGSDMLVTPPANVTADARGVGTVLSKLITHFLASTHILFVDACHDEDTWVTMVACFLDGNHHIQPVGFYVCESERESYWKTFLQMIHMAGLTQETSSELVVISDQDKGIEEAVSDVFSWCEHTPCGVHRERHFQKEWQVAHGKLSKNDIVAAGVLNKMVSLYREAVKATTKEECEMLLNEAEKLEFEYSLQHDCDPVGGVETCYNMNRMTHLARYMKDTKGVWMWEFKFNHLMETTSNAVESCMRWLQIDLFGLGIPRNANLFNRYRLLVMWMMTCDKDRSLKLKGNFKVVQTARGVKEISDWAIGKMVENGHFVETYGEWHVVQRGSEMDCGVGTIEWNGEVTDEDVGDGNFYRVIDKKTRRVYMVNLENWMNPCSCHVTRWLKVPCVHVMMVLKALQSPDMVWCFFGKEYTVEMIQLTCAQWTEQERTLFKWMESIRFTGEEKDNKIVTRETAKGNGTTAKRKTGVWEKLKTS